MAACLIGAAAAAPLLQGINRGTDTLFHLYRLVHLDHLIRSGVLFSRWVPDLAYGYGYPLFNYYGPAGYYFAEIFGLLGMNLPQAFTASFLCAFLLGAWGMFLWISDLFGQRAGLIAAAAYAFSPYMMMTALHRGALPEQLAIGLLPLVLYSFRRLVVHWRWTAGCLAVVSYTGLILTHNITALLFTPVLLGYVVVVATVAGNGRRQPVPATIERLRPALLALIASIAIAAVYWLPAIWERDLVQLGQVFGPAVFDVQRNFLTPADLFVPRFSSDPSLVFERLNFALNPAVLILTGGLIVSTLWRGACGRERQITLLFSLGTLLVCLLTTLPVTSFLWRNLAPLRYLQFPWRFLGPGMVFAAALAGMGGDGLIARLARGRPSADLAAAGCVAFLAILVIPWQFVAYEDPPPATVAGSIQFEQASGLVGTTATGEYTPSRVRQLPAAAAGNWPEDFEGPDPASLPDGARILDSERQPLRYRTTVDTPSPVTLVYNTFFFEGWQAQVDGEDVPIFVSGPHGLIAVPIPAGRHEIVVGFGTTPVRQASGALSAAGLLAAGALLLALSRRKPGMAVAQVDGEPTSRWLLLLLAATLAGLLFVKQGYLDRTDNFFRRSRFDGQAVSGVGIPLAARFGERLILMGVDGPLDVASGVSASFNLYWRAPAPLDAAYSSSLVLRDGQGFVIAQSDNQPIGGVPTNLWKPSQYAQEIHGLHIPPGTPPGTYALQVTVYQLGQPELRLSVLDATGAPAGQSLTIGEINVTRPRRPATLADIQSAGALLAPVSATDGGKALVGYQPPWKEARAGDRIPLITYWQAGERAGGELEAWFELVDASGQTVLSRPLAAVSNDPAFQWQSGDLWRASSWIRLPASLPAGNHTMVVREGDQAVILGTLAVTAPDHSFVAPSPAYGDNTIFGDFARLVGFDMPADAKAGQEVTVTLYWLALGESETSYKTFVQLLDGDQRLVAGSDQVPEGWNRPTTGWVEGEYIRDVHRLLLPLETPAGELTLLVGMYGEESLIRLTTGDGRDARILLQGLQLFEGG